MAKNEFAEQEAELRRTGIVPTGYAYDPHGREPWRKLTKDELDAAEQAATARRKRREAVAKADAAAAVGTPNAVPNTGS